VVIGVLAVVLAAGCANGRNDDASEASGGQVAADGGGVGGGGGEVAAAEPAGALDPRAVVRPSAQLAGAERSVIRTAELQVEVDDVPGASERALAVVEAAGGFLSGQRSDLSGDANAVLTFRSRPTPSSTRSATSPTWVTSWSGPLGVAPLVPAPPGGAGRLNPARSLVLGRPHPSADRQRTAPARPVDAAGAAP
jgi:hypothetical protein